MKPAHEIVAYINNHLDAIMQRPHMYAMNPVALEAVLTALEDVREFAISAAARPSSALDGYTSFLVAKGYGAIGFTTRSIPENLRGATSREEFEPLCEFWKEFMNSEHRARDS